MGLQLFIITKCTDVRIYDILERTCFIKKHSFIINNIYNVNKIRLRGKKILNQIIPISIKIKNKFLKIIEMQNCSLLH